MAVNTAGHKTETEVHEATESKKTLPSLSLFLTISFNLLIFLSIACFSKIQAALLLQV